MSILLHFWFSMTTIADLNDKWAAYAGPGGWNGRNMILLYAFGQRFGYELKQIVQFFLNLLMISLMLIRRPRYVRSWKWWHDI